MATNSLQSLNYYHHHHHQSPLKRYHSSSPTTDYPPTTLFLKPATTTTSNILSISSTATPTFSVSSTTSSITPSTSQPTTTFDLLQQLLSAQNFREADEETRRLLIVLAGESAQKRGYVFFSEVQFISSSDLKTIDDLWKQHSNNKFGYSTQKRIWYKCNKDFTRFFIKVGWMKKLDTEVDQYNYKAFPNDFIWVMNEETPEGHLPLTNALRGTQLLKCILTHPAFDDVQEEEVVEERSSNLPPGGGFSKALSSSTNNNSRQFKSDYSF